jgi:hypothetical protein
VGLLSKDTHKKDLAAFERDISHGRILLMVDVPKEDVEHWKESTKNWGAGVLQGTRSDFSEFCVHPSRAVGHPTDVTVSSTR